MGTLNIDFYLNSGKNLSFWKTFISRKVVIDLGKVNP